MAQNDAVATMNSVVALRDREPSPPATIAPMPMPSTRLGLPSGEELEVLERFGKVYAGSGLVPNHLKSWQAVVVVIRYGYQLGIDEFTALNNIYVINGAPSCSAGLMHGLILRDHGGDAIIPVTVTTDEAVCRYKRREWADYLEHSFTIEQAKKAGLVKPNSNWEKWPEAMNWARLISQVARLGFVDSIKGLYVPEDFGYRVEAGGTLIDTEGHIVESAPSAAAPGGGNKPAGITKDTMGKIHGAAAKRGISHDDLHLAAVNRYGVDSMAALTETQARQLLGEVKAAPVLDDHNQDTTATEDVVAADKADPALPEMRTWSAFWEWIATTEIDTPPREKKVLEELIGERLSLGPQQAKAQIERWMAAQAERFR